MVVVHEHAVQVIMLVFESINAAHCVSTWGMDNVMTWQSKRSQPPSAFLCIIGAVMSCTTRIIGAEPLICAT
jgi:hypothetical protein